MFETVRAESKILNYYVLKIKQRLSLSLFRNFSPLSPEIYMRYFLFFF